MKWSQANKQRTKADRFRSTDAAHRLLAGLLAEAAGLGADALVLVPPCVALALLSKRLAGGRADLKRLPQDLSIRSRPPRCKGAGGGEHIRTVEIVPDSLLQLLDHFLGRAGSGAVTEQVLSEQPVA